ncbi:MAG: hypothetical protein NT069_21160 [Planctomycetota bacterium]|nr:hypothetical protein [Planctomycetota bacterium]
MATIGDLVVNLAVNAAGFATGFNTGSKLVGTFASVTEKSLGTIVGASQAALDTVSKTSVQLVGAIGTAVEKSLGGVAKVVSAWRKGSAEIALANAKAGTEAAKSSLVLSRIKEPKETGGKSSAVEAVAAPVEESKSMISGFIGMVATASNPLMAAAASAFSFGKGLFSSAQGLAAVDDIPAPFAPVQTALDRRRRHGDVVLGTDGHASRRDLPKLGGDPSRLGLDGPRSCV